MEILTEFDALQEAMKKINIDESVMPYCNGRLVDNVACNKIDKILNCPEMISCHKYLYNLDLDQLNEEEIEKIDKLYQLGCDRGFIIDDLTKWDDDTPVDNAASNIVNGDNAEKPNEQNATKEKKPIAGTLFKAKVPCWTVIYSAASRDGEIKTGEAYSNAISAAAAKADVKAKLSNIGYSNITILAIESCEADVEASSIDTAESEEVEENDMLRNRPHNAHIDDPAGVKEAEDDVDEDEVKENDLLRNRVHNGHINDPAGIREADEGDSSDEESEGDSKDDSNEDSDDSSSDESSDDEESSDDADTNDDSDEDSNDSDDDSSQDEESSESSNDKESNDSDDESNDSGKTDDSSSDDEEETKEETEEDSEETSDGESSEEDDEPSDDEESNDEKEELDANQKAELKDKYKKTFKNTLVKCKFSKSFNDLTLEEKIKFFTELSKAWDKNEPNEFMTDKEIEQLNNIVVKNDGSEE